MCSSQREIPYLEKITDMDLRSFAKSDSNDLSTVLVEIDLLEPIVEFLGQDSGLKKASPKRVATDFQRKKDNLVTATKVEQALQKLVARPLRWFPSAHVFIIDVNASEIREIIKLPDVVKVSPNRPL